MRHEKLNRELDLILLLSGPQNYTVDEICERLSISRRNLYYYLHSLKDCGFQIYKHGHCYHIDRRSPFLAHLFEMVQFTDDEAVTLRKLLDMAGDSNPVVQNLKSKLDRFYDFRILSDVSLRKKTAQMVNTLYTAIVHKQLVKIVDYSSPHSQTMSNRFVEPFLLMNNNNDVRCYEMATGQCKTFRLSRMGNVELIDLRWSHEEEHKQVFTDLFMFSGDEHETIRLRLGQLAHSIFLEEFPAGIRYLQPDGPHHWLLSLEVCDYRGIGRFVLGLYEDIEVLDSPAFQQYLDQRIDQMASSKHTLSTTPEK